MSDEQEASAGHYREIADKVRDLAAISQTGEVHRDPGSEKIVLQQWFVSGLKGNPDADGV